MAGLLHLGDCERLHGPGKAESAPGLGSSLLFALRFHCYEDRMDVLWLALLVSLPGWFQLPSRARDPGVRHLSSCSRGLSERLEMGCPVHRRGNWLRHVVCEGQKLKKSQEVEIYTNDIPSILVMSLPLMVLQASLRLEELCRSSLGRVFRRSINTPISSNAFPISPFMKYIDPNLARSKAASSGRIGMPLPQEQQRASEKGPYELRGPPQAR